MTPEAPPKPVWSLLCRPIGADSAPFERVEVRARSVIQAEAILRREGYESLTDEAFVIDGSPSGIRQLRPPRLLCQACEYELDGVRVSESAVVCPECGHHQVVIALRSRRDVAAARTRTTGLNSVVWFFAVIGMLVAAFILLIALLILVS